MPIAKDVLGVGGNTPLVHLSRIGKGLRPRLVAKLEMLNPGGSVKDRIGLAMIEDAEKRGVLKPGGTIVEPTSGNTGVGLAIAAALKGYRLVCTMPDKQSQEKRDILRAYGAEVVICPTAVAPGDPASYYKVAERLAKELPGGYMPGQYWNQQNVAAHYKTTGPELWAQTGGKITHFVLGIGTGGTVTGAGRYLKEQNPAVRIVRSDPEASIYTGDVIRDREGGTPQIVVVSRGDTVRSAIDTMQRYGISQIPVVANGTAARVDDIVGSVQERTMLDRVFREPALVDATVERVMEAPFPVVQANEDVERLYAELAGGVPALLAVDDGRPVSVITKADLLEFVAHQRRAAR